MNQPIDTNDIFVLRRVKDPLDPEGTLVDKVPFEELSPEERQKILAASQRGVTKAQMGRRQAPRINTEMTLEEALKNPFNG